MGLSTKRAITAIAMTLLSACSYPEFGFVPDDATFDDTSFVDALVDGSGSDTTLDTSLDTTINDLGPVDSGTDVRVDSPADTSGYPCDPAATPDPAGIFVSPTGDDGAAGKSVSPLKTITKAMALAQSTKAPHVYLDEGTYAEGIAFASATAVHGGWQRSGAAWTRDCRIDARLHTVINPVRARVVTAKGFVGKAELEDVTVVNNEAKGDPSESEIAIMITGDGILFHLAAVDASSTTGGPGTAATTFSDPGAHGCNGYSDCSSGAAGSPGAAGSNASAGTFALDGFTPGDGNNGRDGTPGSNGTKGGAGAHGTTCVGCASGCPACTSSGASAMDGPDGTCGCGGNAGKGGSAGHGGGASIAVFISGKGATLSIDHSTLRAFDGGAGSSGAGYPAGSAKAGARGNDMTSFCASSCGPCSATSVCGLTGTWLAGGSAGGTGGSGGPGGKGGGGAGGPSYGIVAVGGATMIVDVSTAIMFGSGGKGADGAPSGASGATLSLP